MLVILLSPACILGQLWGSWQLHFSMQATLFPLLGSMLGVLGIASFYGFWLATNVLTPLISGTALMTFNLPSLFAAFSWRATDDAVSGSLLDVVMHLLLPAVAIVAFCVHPVGKQSYVYSFYWVVPMVAFCMRFLTKHCSLLMRALSSTFVAHAVGSIMFLYSVKTSPALWLSLLPQVAVERAFMASIMIAGYVVLHGLFHVAESFTAGSLVSAK